jgi:hypothetical protein
MHFPHREEREGREVWGAWVLKKSHSPIGDSEFKGHAIKWLRMVFVANGFDFAHIEPFAVNCMDPA